MNTNNVASADAYPDKDFSVEPYCVRHMGTNKPPLIGVFVRHKPSSMCCNLSHNRSQADNLKEAKATLIASLAGLSVGEQPVAQSVSITPSARDVAFSVPLAPAEFGRRLRFPLDDFERNASHTRPSALVQNESDLVDIAIDIPPGMAITVNRDKNQHTELT